MDEEKYFEDALLLLAFAREREAEFIAFVEEYLEEQEIESRLNDERENEEN